MSTSRDDIRDAAKKTKGSRIPDSTDCCRLLLLNRVFLPSLPWRLPNRVFLPGPLGGVRGAVKHFKNLTRKGWGKRRQIRSMSPMPGDFESDEEDALCSDIEENMDVS